MIQKTKNYGQFIFLEKNRAIAKPRILALEKSIKQVGFIDSRPIIVSPKMEIIDGQARFEALKKLNMEITYQIEYGDKNELMVILNKAQQSWQFRDYVDFYANDNVTFYQKVKEISEIKSLQTSNALVIVAGTKVPGDKVKIGYEFQINPFANEIVNFLTKASLTLPYWKTHKFVYSIVELFKKTNTKQRDILLKKIPTIPQQVTVSDYLFYFENILNKYKKTDDLKIKLISAK